MKHKACNCSVHTQRITAYQYAGRTLQCDGCGALSFIPDKMQDAEKADTSLEDLKQEKLMFFVGMAVVVGAVAVVVGMMLARVMI